MKPSIRPYQPVDREAIKTLWQACDLTRPWNNPDQDIDRKVAHSPDGFLIAEINRGVVGCLMAGYDGHRGWINYMAVSPSHQRLGIGGALMTAATQWLTTQGCPKINMQVRASNAAVILFYQSLGYDEDACLSLGQRLVIDQPSPDKSA